MNLITLTSDYGLASPYVGALKGALYSKIAGVQVVDVTHVIKPHDILQAAYILKHAAISFPERTVHLISVDTSITMYKKYLVVLHNNQYYIGADNGIFSLLFDAEPYQVFKVKPELIDEQVHFPDKSLFVDLANRIFSNESLDSFCLPSAIDNIKQNIAPVVDENMIRGSIIFVDGYGNAVSNIGQGLFNRKSIDKKRFAIFYKRKQKITHISRNYDDVKNGEELALFNEAGLLEIAMNTGKAGQLLGLQQGSQIFIEFYD